MKTNGKSLPAMWRHTISVNDLPFISILIAARNEEDNIERLLISLEKLSYPSEKFEVLLGNDASDDQTANIIEKYTEKHKNWKVIHLEDQSNSKLKGKARVLNELEKVSTGKFLFFTDADISLPITWIESTLTHFDDKVGVVVGTTSMESNDFFAKMQSMEWLSVLYFNKVMSDAGIATTGMGNNMAVRKEAYHAAGTYEKIGFSIVEDYALYKAIIDSGYGFKQSFEKENHAFTLPPKNFLKQRTRWISGAIKSKSKFVILAVVQALSLPIYLFLAFWNWKICLGLWMVTVIVNLFIMNQSEQKLGLKKLSLWTPIFSIYVPVSWFIQFSYYLFAAKNVKWKGRNYEL